MENTQKNGGSLRDLVYVFFRRKWVIIGVLLATVIPVTIYTLLIPPAYESKSRLLVKPGRVNIYVAPVGDPGGQRPPTIIQRVAELINSEIEILKSRVLMRRVVEQFRIAGTFPNNLPEKSMAAHADDEESFPIDIAVNQALRNLSVDRIRGTDIINVAFRSSDPDIPADFVNTLVDFYFEHHLKVHQSAKSYSFFKAQSVQLEQELKTAARRLSDFNKKYGIVSFNAMKGLILGKYTEVKAAIKENETAIKVAQTRIEKLKEDLSRVSEHKYTGQSESSDSAISNSLNNRLVQLEMQKLDLEHKYKPDFRFARIDAEMDKVREMLANEQEKFHGSISSGLNALHERLQGDLLAQKTNLKALQTKGAGLERQLIEYGQELERLGRLEPELRALERAVDAKRQNYSLYRTKFEESRVSDAMDAAKMVSLTILEPANPPLGPIAQKKGLKIFMSFCIAGVAGLGFAFLLHYYDHTFKFSEDVIDKLKVPLLCTIEDLPTTEEEDLEVIAASPKPPLHYQILKSNIMMHAGEKGVKTLSICSPTPREGSSTVALNLAASLANSGSRLVLVDANLRAPFLHSSSKLPSSPGFSEIIHEGTDVHEAIKESIIPNLFVLTSGASPPNPMVIFESPKLVELIQVLRREFDWIIFDSAPADVYPESTVLARQLDGVVLVVEAENKGAEVAIKAKEKLEQAGAKIVGAVLNRQRRLIPETIYQRL